MMYIPEQWEENSKKQIIPLHITTHKKLRPGKDFGGYMVLTDGKITSAALITTDEGNVQISIIINEQDSDYQIFNGEMVVFDVPLVVCSGDIIKIGILTSSCESGNVTGENVSMLIELI